MSISRLKDECLHNGRFSFDTIGDAGLVFAVNTGGETTLVCDDRATVRELLLLPVSKACKDSRVVWPFGLFPEEIPRLIDVHLLYEKDHANSIIHKKSDLSTRLEGFRRASQTVGVDETSRQFLFDVVPRGLVCDLLSFQTKNIYDLAWGGQWAVEDDEARRLHRALFTLMRIEQSNIFVDISHVQYLLERNDLSVATRGCLRSMLDRQRDGLVWTRLEPTGVRTKRYRVAGGFNCMGIPHGPARECIVSRYPNGNICSVDFNAIDYRCIVSSVDDQDFKQRYYDCQDFHLKTSENLLETSNISSDQRRVIKACVYVYFYGGSEETLAKKTDLSLETIRKIVKKLEKQMGPISRFRGELYRRSMKDGFISLPDGSHVVISQDDHPGKILGLYAQACSAQVFERALLGGVVSMRGFRSLPIFPVHDETVFDVHPEEREDMLRAVAAMETCAGPGYKLKIKMGESYDETSKQ